MGETEAERRRREDCPSHDERSIKLPPVPDDLTTQGSRRGETASSPSRGGGGGPEPPYRARHRPYLRSIDVTATRGGRW